MIFMILCGIFVICIVKIYLKFKPFLDLQKKTNHCNYAAFKLIGCDAYNIYDKFQRVLKGHNSFWLGDYLSVIIDDPDDLKTVFNAEETFNKSLHYKFFFKNGLFVDGGEKYKTQRKAISPLFHPATIRQNIPITNEKIDEFFTKFSDDIDGKVLDARELTFYFSTKTVSRTLFDVKNEFADANIDSMRHNAEKFTCLASSRIFKPWLAKDLIFNRTSLSKEIFNLKEQIFHKDLGLDFAEYFDTSKEINSRSFFDLMKKVSMPYDELLEATIFFMGASAETTSSSISNILHLLGMYQTVQEKLYEELKTVLKSGYDHVTEDEISKMPYLDLVIKEGLRLLPVAIIQGRVVTKPIKLKKYTLPVGTVAHIPTLEMHTDPKYWGDDALDFRPERFHDDNFKNIHPYAYIPFSNGQRICPGMKYAQMTMKIFLSRFLMEFKVTSPLKYTDLKFVMGLTLKTRQDPTLLFEKRNK